MNNRDKYCYNQKLIDENTDREARNYSIKN